jgi:hypothetical protein
MTDWKLWSEQPPTRADADERGLVECYGKDTGGRWFADLEPLLAVGDWVYWRTPTPGPSLVAVSVPPSCDCLERLAEAAASTMAFNLDTAGVSDERYLCAVDVRQTILAAIAAKKGEAT